MDNEEIKNRIEKLEQIVNENSNKQIEDSNKLSMILNKDIIDRNISNSSKDVLQQIIEERLMDIIWNNYFIFSTFFESLDGWDDLSSAGSSIAITGSSVTLTTDNEENDDAEIFKSVFVADDFSFSKEQRYKTSIQVDSVSEIDCLAIVGKRLAGTTYGVSYYGFHLVDDELRGISVFDSNTTEVVLQDISADTPYELEARLFKNRLVFLVNGVEKGIITGANVVGDIIGQTSDDLLAFTYRVETTDTNAKEMQFSYLEYAMKK